MPEVDDDPAVVGRAAADAMTAAAHRQRDILGAGEGERSADVIDTAGTDHQPGRSLRE
jgi:hypothetical protein